MTSQSDIILTASAAATPFQLIRPFAEQFNIMDADELVHDFTRALNEGLAREINTNEDDNRERVKLITRLTKWQGLVQNPRFHLSAVRYFERKARGTPLTPPPRTESSPYTRVYDIEQDVENNRVVSEKELQVDGIFLTDGSETVGQRIKEAALSLESAVLSPGYNGVHERKVFILGASSILDLVDRSPESQFFQVFTDERERDEILEVFSNLDIGDISTVPNQEKLLSHWDACIAHVAVGGLASARSYLLGEMSDNEPEFTNELWLLLIMVDTLINNPEIFSQEAGSTDKDLLFILWRPLITRLFYQGQAKTKIRVKSGESTPAAPYATERAYYDDDNTATFKTDSRVLMDDEYEGEIDLAAIVVASDSPEPKLSSDGAKVLREAKEIVDGLVTIFPDDEGLLRNAVGYGIQIVNLRAIFFSLHLVAPKLYVAWPQHRVGLPSSIGSLDDFREVIMALNWFRHVIQRTSRRVQATLSLEATIDDMYGYNDNNASLDQQKWVSQTWYSPTKLSKTRPIRNLMKVPFPILSIPSEQTETSSRDLHADAKYDKNGWAVVRVEGELKFFNKYTGKYLKERGGKKPRLE